MDSVNQKYINFQQFIRSAIPNPSMTILAFLESPLELFLKTLYEYAVNQKMTNKKMLTMITDKLDIDLKTIKDEDVARFLRYIDYFKNCSKVIYG